MKTLGVDPGIRGGLAIVEMTNGMPTVISAIEVPTIGTGAKERVVSELFPRPLRRRRPERMPA